MINFINAIKILPPYYYFIICIIVGFTFVFIKEKTTKEKTDNGIILFKLFLTVGVQLTIIMLFKGIISLLISIIFGPIISYAIYNKFVEPEEPKANQSSNNEININIMDENLSCELNGERLDVSGNRLNFEGLEHKADYNNILDILVVYDYISPNHRRKIYEESIINDDPDIDVKKLLVTPIISEDDLNEAKNIQNLVRLEGCFLNKEDMLKKILKAKNKRTGGHRNNGNTN